MTLNIYIIFFYQILDSELEAILQDYMLLETQKVSAINRYV